MVREKEREKGTKGDGKDAGLRAYMKGLELILGEHEKGSAYTH